MQHEATERNTYQAPNIPAVKQDLEGLRRKNGVRDLQKRFLIVCEDHKSAPNYFNALKKHESLSATSIEVFGNEGKTQPIQVVQAAIQRKKTASNENGGTEPFDQVWCVIDGDYGSAINNARTCAQANGIHLAISTKCFEYWVLLHFEEYGQPAENCNNVVHILKKKHLKQYTKGECDFTDTVRSVREACERAQRLRKDSVLPEEQNPCSDVYLLINAILAAIPLNAVTASKTSTSPIPKQKRGGKNGFTRKQ